MFTLIQINLIKQFGIHEIAALENLWEEIIRETQAQRNVRAWLESQGTMRNELEDLGIEFANLVGQRYTMLEQTGQYLSL